jgi:class 3 adenylate cyclase
MVLNLVGLGAIVFFPLSFYISAFRGAHAALQAERLRTEALVANMLPASVASRLKAGERLIADELSDVVVLFADVVGFTAVTERLPAEQIVRWLNDIFTSFDRLTEEKGLDKIKTVGDSYMVAGGITAGDGPALQTMAELALAMRVVSRDMSIDDGMPVQLRFGMDVGPVIAGVVGEQMLAYDLYGDVVNTASRMASHGSPDRIHVTGRVRAGLDGRYCFESTGGVQVKGKGEMETFYLERAPGG